MQTTQHVRKTDLARNTRQVLKNVQRGRTAIIENHGQPEAAIIDINDYLIVHAVMRYYGQRPPIEIEAGLNDEHVSTQVNEQDRYDLVFAHYLATAISLSRAAELLGLTWLDLRTRCLRLNVPLRTVPATRDEACADADLAATLPTTA
jgi:antitoxin (DNA-binding transcriptional repressor) of toxin-antitoxin stability system